MAEDKIEESVEERRFGGVSRLYGPELRERFRSATVVVAGLGGVGSWAGRRRPGLPSGSGSRS